MVFIKNTFPAVDTGFNAKFVDIDGDGDTDFYYLKNISNSVVWYQHLQMGHYQERTLTIDIESDSIGWINLLDMDLDGDLDVIPSNPFRQNSFFWLENNGTPDLFGHKCPIDVENAHYVNSVFDVNEDNKPDYTFDIGPLGGPYQTTLFHSQPDGTYHSQEIEHSLYNEQCYDFDGDGNRDIIADGQTWFLNSGTGNFIPYTPYSEPEPYTYDKFYIMRPIPSGADNLRSLLISVHEGTDAKGEIWRLEKYTFQSGSLKGTNNILQRIYGREFVVLYYTDLNGDNIQDIVWSQKNNGKREVNVRYGTPDGEFAKKELLIILDATPSVTLIDFDADGDLDIVGQDPQRKKYSLYINTPDTTTHLHKKQHKPLSQLRWSANPALNRLTLYWSQNPPSKVILRTLNGKLRTHITLPAFNQNTNQHTLSFPDSHFPVSEVLVVEVGHNGQKTGFLWIRSLH